MRIGGSFLRRWDDTLCARRRRSRGRWYLQRRHWQHHRYRCRPPIRKQIPHVPLPMQPADQGYRTDPAASLNCSHGPVRRSLGRRDGAGCSPTTCTADGLSNYVQRSYTYGADGKITGTIKTNNCITHSVSSGSSGTFSCEEQTFPDPSYASTPAAIPLLGRAGMRCARVHCRGHTH